MTDIEQAREIAVALTRDRHPDANWLSGWISNCRVGEYDGDDDVIGPLVGIRMARGMSLTEAMA